ncbi:hypothetical protein AB4154_20315 [Vibrio sp. 10N.286.51.B11]|uniref:hypothetical protein n=1 Tax=unclassified Vibrio TaxID=2614977 RepID=UPI00354B5AE2
MKRSIPAPVIAVLSNNLAALETHASLDNLFLYADAPGEPPEGSKPVKVQAWLRLINKESDDPLKVLGKLIETFMELPEQEEEDVLLWGTNVTNHKKNSKESSNQFFHSAI